MAADQEQIERVILEIVAELHPDHLLSHSSPSDLPAIQHLGFDPVQLR
jgi:hypothetical protein